MDSGNARGSCILASTFVRTNGEVGWIAGYRWVDTGWTAGMPVGDLAILVHRGFCMRGLSSGDKDLL